MSNNINETPSQFVKLDDAIKYGIMLSGESNNPSIYAKFKYFSLQLMNELEWDVLKNFKYQYLGVDPMTKSCKLPIDFVQWARVALVNQTGELVDLVEDRNIALAAGVENCNEVSKHCDCGCTDEVCYAVSSATVSETDVVINGTTYTKTETVCTRSDGKIIKRICVPVVTNPTKTCNYSILINEDNFPYSNVSINKNGVNYFIGDIEDVAALIVIMTTGNGFTNSSLTFTKNTTTDVWQNFIYTDADNNPSTLNFTQSSCVQPVPTVDTQCYDEVLCEAEVADCGCFTVTDFVVNTLGSWGILQQEFIQRYLKISDWQLALKQPMSYFGYFKVDAKNQILRLDQTYPWDTVYLEYYSANEVTGGEYNIPVFAKEPLAWGLKWLYSETRKNISRADKDRDKKQWYNAKLKLRGRLNPPRIEQLLQVMRANPRP